MILFMIWTLYFITYSFTGKGAIFPRQIPRKWISDVVNRPGYDDVIVCREKEWQEHRSQAGSLILEKKIKHVRKKWFNWINLSKSQLSTLNCILPRVWLAIFHPSSNIPSAEGTEILLPRKARVLWIDQRPIPCRKVGSRRRTALWRMEWETRLEVN